LTAQKFHPFQAIFSPNLVEGFTNFANRAPSLSDHETNCQKTSE